MKKHVFLFLSLLFVSGIISAQKGSIKKADKLFQSRSYAEAALMYENQERTVKVLQNLGDSYYYNLAYLKAAKTYEELFSKQETPSDKEYYFKYGQSLKAVNKYDEADKYLSLYFEEPVNTDAFIKKTDKNVLHIFKLEENKGEGSNNDFGLSFYGENKVAFASTRNTKRDSYSWNGLPYLDLFQGVLNNNVIEEVLPFPDEINTDSHESNAVFTKDGNIMYFNRTNKRRQKVGQEKIANIKIYKSEFINGNWTNVTPLPFTSDIFSTEHPALSKDEKTLYFASDMPGTLGSFDIFKVAINDDGTYGTPENLGPVINTKHREQFPFISDSDVLYFSSDGHEGFGCLDIFNSKKTESDYEKPMNLGSTINSNSDDYAFILKEEKEKGFFSSNRSGIDKIYGFIRQENPLKMYHVEGSVEDIDNKKLLPGSLVTLFDETNTIIQDTIVGESSHYSFRIEPNKKYKLRGTFDKYSSKEIEILVPDSINKFQQNVVMTHDSITNSLLVKGKEGDLYANKDYLISKESLIKQNANGELQVKIENILFNFDKFNIRKDAAQKLDVLVNLMKKYPKMEILVSAHTDARGSSQYNLHLSKQRASSTVEYLVSQGIEKNRIQSIGYGESKPINKCVKSGICSEKEYQVNRRCEFTILNI